MTAPVVSCIIPVLDGERYLGAALESVLTQTYGAVEVIVADDGSTDGTRAVASAFGSRVRYLHQANAGHAAARNLGLAAAGGAFVAFLDADDLWHADKLARQIEHHCGKPRGWLDEARGSDAPTPGERAFLDLALAAHRATDAAGRRALRAQLKAIVAKAG